MYIKILLFAALNTLGIFGSKWRICEHNVKLAVHSFRDLAILSPQVCLYQITSFQQPFFLQISPANLQSLLVDVKANCKAKSTKFSQRIQMNLQPTNADPTNKVPVPQPRSATKISSMSISWVI